MEICCIDPLRSYAATCDISIYRAGQLYYLWLWNSQEVRQGCKRVAVQAAAATALPDSGSGRVQRARSWMRYSPSTQSSTASKYRRKPPQLGGRGTFIEMLSGSDDPGPS